MSHPWISTIHQRINSQGENLPQPWRVLNLCSVPLALWRIMMWTWVRKRRVRCSQENPQQVIGGRTTELREEEEAAWQTAVVGLRSSRISLYLRLKTSTVEHEPDSPASLWVTVPSLSVRVTQALNSSPRKGKRHNINHLKISSYKNERQVWSNMCIG